MWEHPPWKEVEGIPDFRDSSLGNELFDFNKSVRPSQFTWTDKGVLLPIADQRPHQTCVAFSVCYCLQTRRRIAGDAIPTLDPEMFHGCVLGLPFSQGNDDLFTTLTRLNQFGAPVEGSGFAPGLRCRDFRPSLVRSIASSQMDQAELTKKIVSSYSPVVVLISAEPRLAYVTDFSIYRDMGGPKTFHHAMLLVGYDDVAQCWIVQNSHGLGWGHRGFGRIAYDSASILSDSRHRCYLAA